MSEVKIRLSFQDHVCTNHTPSDFTLPDPDCGCSNCRCDEGGYCCHSERDGTYCSDCGGELERPCCYLCNGEDCGCGERVSSGDDVTYTGTVSAEWKDGKLIRYTGGGHPHLTGTYCLGSAAELFENVTTKEQAVEAVVTHISNVDFNDGLGSAGDYYGIEAT